MTTLISKLTDLYAELAECSECRLSSDYRPQLRPPGPQYQPGGVVFVQINPGHIGCLSDEEINERYKRECNRKVARFKAESAGTLLKIQQAFLDNPSYANYERLRAGCMTAMKEVWGWPKGKYGKVIEQHGVSIELVAVVNLAQCPIPDNAYRQDNLNKCWHWTEQMLRLLQPKVIVAQGEVVLDFLKDPKRELGAKIVEGVHHASRRSKEDKDRLFANASKVIQNQGQYLGR